MGPDSQFKKVLMVALEFPPCHSAGVKRTLTFYRNLESFGWKPIVLTARASIYDRTDPNSTESTFATDSVYRAFGLNAYRHLSVRGKHWGRLSDPDRFASWFWHAVLLGRRLIKQHRPDAIWSTFPCSTAHDIACRLANEFELPWVADFRDPYRAENEPDGAKKVRASRVDLLTATHAAKLVFTTRQSQYVYLRRYNFLAPDKAQVIPNGFVENEFCYAERELAAKRQAEKTLRPAFTVLHSGSLYGGTRDPRPLLEAVAQLKSREKLPENFQLVFRGVGRDPKLEAMITNFGLEERVKLRPTIPFNQSLVELLEADALLVIQAPEHQAQIPGKVYEYLRAKKPILSLGTSNSAIKQLLADIPHAVFADIDDRPSSEVALSALCTVTVDRSFDPSPFSRLRGVKSLAHILDATQLAASTQEIQTPKKKLNPRIFQESFSHGPGVSIPSNQPLRVCVLEPLGDRMAWVNELINSLNNAQFVGELVPIQVAENPQTQQEVSLKRSQLLKRSRLKLLTSSASYIHERLLERRAYVKDAFAKLPQPSTFRFTPSAIHSNKTRHPDTGVTPPYFASSLTQKFDVILNCTAFAVPAELASSSLTGIWNVSSTALTTTSDSQDVIGITAAESRLQEIRLSIHNYKEYPPIQYSKAVIARNSISEKDNLSSARWKAVSILLHELSRLQRIGAEAFFKRASENCDVPITLPVTDEHKTHTAKLLSSMFSTLRHKTLHTFDLAIHEYRWEIIYQLANGFTTDFSSYKGLKPTAAYSWADPHFIYRDGRHYVFYEERPSNTEKGHISCFTIDHDGRVSPCGVVLARPYHLSFPFVFEYCDDIYMIPETSENKTIELYKARRFPDEWEHVKDLFTKTFAVDTTLSFHSGKIWMFTSIKAINSAPVGDEMSVFWTDDLLDGEWTAHPKNPVVADCRNARSAGSIFQQNGLLLRPAQIGTPRYGFGISLNHISTLSELDFKESSISELLPNWSPDIFGIHTINCDDRLCVADVLRRRRRTLGISSLSEIFS